jgi:type II secretory pathway component PulF
MKDSNNNLVAATPGRSDATSRNGLFIVGLLAAVVAAAIATLVVPQFRNLFQGFGGDLPLATRLAVDYYLALWLLPIVVIAVRLAWPDSSSRSTVACIVGVGSLIVTIPTLTVVLYLPIFKLGQTV